MVHSVYLYVAVTNYLAINSITIQRKRITNFLFELTGLVERETIHFNIREI